LIWSRFFLRSEIQLKGSDTTSTVAAHFEFVIADDGKEIKGFPVDAGYAVSGPLMLEKSRQ
jgi:hypothetical protein